MADECGSVMRSVALVLARASAVKRGDLLSEDEMKKIVGDLLALPSPSLTPYGKCVYRILTGDMIEKFIDGGVFR